MAVLWVVALLGMATGYAESLLAQLYKVRDDRWSVGTINRRIGQ